MGFAMWLEDLRWMRNARRCRRIRRKLGFAARTRFDDAARPRIWSHSGDKFLSVAYPDAFYHMTIEDICRGIEAAHWERPDR